MKQTMLSLFALALIPCLGKAQNTPPTIAAISNETLCIDHPALIVLTVNDAQTAVSNLQLSLASSNPALVPADHVVFRNFIVDGRWYITLVPAFGMTGTATNTVTVSDGTYSATASFVLTVNPPPPGAQRFTSLSPMAIPEAGAATPYPSTINVTGMSGTLTNVTLTVSRLHHQYPGDFRMLLVGPANQGAVVWAKSGGSHAATNLTVTLIDTAPFPLPEQFEIWSEQLSPANWAATNFFPQPAPAGPYGTNLSVFNGRPANGAWSLYVYDDEAPDHGGIAGGWSLMLQTTGGGVPQLKILSLTGAGTTNVVLNWSAISNVTYRVQYQSTPNSPIWSNLVPDVTATSSTASATDNRATTAGRFYRIRVVP